VPVFAFLVAGRLIARFGPAVVLGAGSLIFAAGVLTWALAVGVQPDYAADVLAGMLLTGIGVGLTLPTFMATAASSLPPQAFATGSGTVNMLRQVGMAVGVAILIAIIGTHATPGSRLAGFQHGWIAIAVLSVLAAVAAISLRRRTVRAASATGLAPPT
jgi:MFS family permease